MSDQINITLPDSSVITADRGSSVYDIIGIIGQGLQKAAVTAKVNNELVDLTKAVESDSTLSVFTFKTEEGKDTYWHSGSHLLAQAVTRIFKDVKLAIGPATSEGFYYDFDAAEPFTPEDLEKIEKEMQRIVEENIQIKRDELPRADAIKQFEEKNELYKVELLNELEDENVTVYSQGDFIDLCRGPHVKSTGDLKAFKLLSIAGAYWRGDEKNKMLQRIYGISFPSDKELKKHIKLLEEAKERDHRKIGKELDLFSFSNDVGAGLPLWHPKGAVLRYIIEKYETGEHIKRGYNLLMVPHIAKGDLYKTSGHLDFYSENMYSPIEIEGQDYYIKPMNCPSQIQIFNSSLKSYRELPARYFEMGTVYRYERSGVLHGLTRVRGFTQDDAHIYCNEEQLEDEIKNVLNFTLEILETFGFKDKNIYLSTRPEKSVGSDDNWELATESLKKALEANNIQFKVDPGEGVFYGPKIDIKIKDAIGREWQCSTIQVDFNLPERFDISYVGQDGQKHRPIMIHRALLGSLERFIGILIEHYSGKFPVWLSPVQIILLNIGEDEIKKVEDIKNRLQEEEIRVETDLRDETISYKVRDAISNKAPYIGVIGKKESLNDTISIRKRGDNNSNSMGIDEFIDLVKKEVINKS